MHRYGKNVFFRMINFTELDIALDIAWGQFRRQFYETIYYFKIKIIFKQVFDIYKAKF